MERREALRTHGFLRVALMFKENFQNLFADFEPEIQTLITRVLIFEQEYITHDRGRMSSKMKEELDQIITQVASSKQAERERSNDDSEQQT